MSYAEFSLKLKDVSIKTGKATVEIELYPGLLDTLHDMIGKEIDASFEVRTITHKREMNAKTNKPLNEYTVDQSTGFVEQVKKPDAEQMELPGMPPKPQEHIEVKIEPVEVEREIIDNFILTGLAPSNPDQTLNAHDFHDILTRRYEKGETYHHIAASLKISSGEFVEVLDRYRTFCAPLAQKWDEWRKNPKQAEPDAPAAVIEEIEQPVQQEQEGEITAAEEPQEGTEERDTPPESHNSGNEE